MRRKPIQHHIDGLAALLLFGVFAVCVLAVLLTGADAYRRLTQRDQAAYDRRTCEQYLTTRVRQADRTGSVAIENRGGTDVLVLGADEEYITYIYYYDGWLMELYIWSGEPMVPEEGRQLLEAEGLEMSLEGNLLTFKISPAPGVTDTMLLSLRGEEGVDA